MNVASNGTALALVTCRVKFQWLALASSLSSAFRLNGPATQTRQLLWRQYTQTYTQLKSVAEASQIWHLSAWCSICFLRAVVDCPSHPYLTRMNGPLQAAEIVPARHHRTSKTLGKRPAADANPDHRASKQARLNNRDEDSVASRWTRVFYEVIDLTKDTLNYLAFGDCESGYLMASDGSHRDSPSPAPKETILPVARSSRIPNGKALPTRRHRSVPPRQRIPSQFREPMPPPPPPLPRNGAVSGIPPLPIPNGDSSTSNPPSPTLRDEPASSPESKPPLTATASAASTVVDLRMGPPKKHRTQPPELQEFKWREQMRALGNRQHILHEKVALDFTACAIFAHGGSRFLSTWLKFNAIVRETKRSS
jgi:hypothetical protein